MHQRCHALYNPIGIQPLLYIYIYCELLHSLYNQYSFTVVVRAVPLQRMHLVAAIAKLSCPRYANACKGCIACHYMYSNRQGYGEVLPNFLIPGHGCALNPAVTQCRIGIYLGST